MEKQYLKLSISETGIIGPLKERKTCFNKIAEKFKSMKDLKEYLRERYGKIPAGRNKIYEDGPDGKAVVVGFMHSFWNSDISHNSKAWHQTDWITITHVTEKPVLINDKRY